MRLPKEITEVKTALESKGFSTRVEIIDDSKCFGENTGIVLDVFIKDKKFATLSLRIIEEMKNYAISKKEIVRSVKVHEIPNTINAGRKGFERRLANFVQSLPETFWPRTI